MTIESLEILGTVKLNGTTVSKLLKVTGNLVAQSATLNQVEVEGDARLTDTILEQQMSITGSFQASGSKFRNPVSFTGQKILFSKCTLSGITIQRDAAFRAKQIIELKDKTVIDGPVVFEGGNGEILLYPGSKILGSISGGKIIYKN